MSGKDEAGKAADSIDFVRREIDVLGGRAIARALQILARRHRLVVNYEDPVFMREGEPVFLTPVTRPAVHGVAPDVFVPVSSHLATTYDVLPSGAPVDSEAVVRQVLASADGDKIGARFVLVTANDAWSAVPLLPAGEPRPLDFEIAVESRTWTGRELLSRIAALASEKAAMPIRLAGSVGASRSGRRLVFGMQGAARTVLNAAMRQLGNDVSRLGYHALFDQALGWLMLNLRVLPAMNGYAPCPGGIGAPTGESSFALGPADPYFVNFEATLVAPSRLDGVVVTEHVTAVDDGCHFKDSAVLPYSVGNDWWVVSDRQYGPDEIGIDCAAHELYMHHWQNATRTITLQQLLTIALSTQTCSYRTNQLQIVVAPDKVTITRDNASCSLKKVSC